MTAKKHDLLRNRNSEDVKVESVELLFDLIYVFSVTRLSHYLLDHLNTEGALQTLVMWFAVWLGWQYNTWITNWFNPEKMKIRLMLFAVMLVGLIMAVSIPSAFENLGPLFAVSYVTIQFGRSLFILLVLGKDQELSDNYLRITIWLAISGVFWITGSLMTGYLQLALWAIAAACEYCGPMFGFRLPVLGRSKSEDWNIDGGHMAERCQLFIIVALGESILITGATMGDHRHWDIPVLLAFLSSFLSSLAMWWIYFDTSSKDGSKAITHAKNPGLVGAKFNYIHVTLVAGIIVSAVSNELVIARPGEHTAMASIMTLIGGPLLYLAGNSLYKKVVYGHIPLSHWLAIAVLAASIPVSFITDLLATSIFATIVLIILALYDGCSKRKPEIGIS